NDIPPGWCAVRLGDVTELRTAKVEPTETRVTNYVSLEHIESSRYRLTEIGSSDNVTSTKTVFQSGDVLYGKLRPYLNKVVLAPFDGVCSTDILVFAETEALDNHFLLRILSRRETVDFAVRSSQGTNLPRISSAALAELPILLPPRNEQKRIAAKIDSLLEDIESARGALKSISALAEKLRQAVLAAAFRGDLTDDWRGKNPNIKTAAALLD